MATQVVVSQQERKKRFGCLAQSFPQQFLYFLPLPQGQGAFLGGFPTNVNCGLAGGTSKRLS